MTDHPTRRAAGALIGTGLYGVAGAAMGCGAPIRRDVRPDGLRWTPDDVSRGTVLLVHGLGTTGHLYDLPGVGGLGPILARSGFTVLAPDLSALSRLDDWVRRLDTIVSGARGPVVGVGLDLGGTALYRVQAPMTGRVGIGAPIASGGFSPTMRAVLSTPGAPSWRALGGRSFSGQSIARLILTTGLPSRIEQPLRRSAMAPMPEALRRDWLIPGARSPIPVLMPELSPGSSWGPTRIITATGDGLAPPWQCDPRAFDCEWDGLETTQISRVNGHETEFNHLDLVVSPGARRHVWPSLVRWIVARCAEAA